MIKHFSRAADFLVSLRLTGRKSDRNESFLSEKTSFGNFLLAPYTPPLRIQNTQDGESNEGSANPERYFRCQIFSLYSLIVRSEEKMPDLAVLITAIRSHLSRS